jgi:hypothetical protein
MPEGTTTSGAPYFGGANRKISDREPPAVEDNESSNDIIE